MNYINHLNSFYTKLYSDDRFTPHHVSLYSAIFQLWNQARFKNAFQVNRQELMKLSKIGSVNTYIRCLRELHTWGFIEYNPSKSMFVGSRLTVIRFDNSTGNTADKTTEIPLLHLNKQVKTPENNLNIPSLKEVEEFFKAENFPEKEALLFFTFNQSRAWMIGKNPILNWQAAAITWVSKALLFRAKNSNKKASSKQLTLSVNTNKNYNEPL